MKQHTPNCSSNIACAVYHIDGGCPGYKACDCGFERPEKKATPAPPKEKCEKCKIGKNEKGHSGYPDKCFHCDNLDCGYVECADGESQSQPQVAGWEEEFDVQFPPRKTQMGVSFRKEQKSFISKLLASEREEERIKFNEEKEGIYAAAQNRESEIEHSIRSQVIDEAVKIAKKVKNLEGLESPQYEAVEKYRNRLLLQLKGGN